MVALPGHWFFVLAAVCGFFARWLAGFQYLKTFAY